MLKKSINMVVWVVLFQLIGYFLGHITQINMTTWYLTLHKSSLTPPSIVFPIVWSILYTMIAASGCLLWQHNKEPKARMAIVFFSAQMLLNWAWSPLFFNWHQIGPSFFCILFIILFTLITIILTKDKFKLSAFLLVPYLVWSIFAAYLNAVLWIFN